MRVQGECVGTFGEVLGEDRNETDDSIVLLLT